MCGGVGQDVWKQREVREEIKKMRIWTPLGAIRSLTEQIGRATSESRIEKLTERREYWLAQVERERKERGDEVRTKEDLEKAFPGIPVYQMPEDMGKLVDALIGLKRPDPKAVDEIMREYGDGTAQGEDDGKPETD